MRRTCVFACVWLFPVILLNVLRAGFSEVWDVEMMQLPEWLTFSSAGASSSSMERSTKKPRTDGNAVDELAPPPRDSDECPQTDVAAVVVDAAVVDDGVMYEPTQLVVDAAVMPVVPLARPPQSSVAAVDAIAVPLAHESLSVAMESAPTQTPQASEWQAAVETAGNLDNNPEFSDAVFQLMASDSKLRALVSLTNYVDEGTFMQFVETHILPHLQYKRPRK